MVEQMNAARWNQQTMPHQEVKNGAATLRKCNHIPLAPSRVISVQRQHQQNISAFTAVANCHGKLQAFMPRRIIYTTTADAFP